MARTRHPHKDIEASVSYAESRGWALIPAKGHAWGILRCPWNDEECRCGEFCQISVWSTPRNPEGFARKLRRLVDGCIHAQEGSEDCDV